MSQIVKPNHYIGDKGLEVNEIHENFLNRYNDGMLAHYVANAIEYLLRAPLKNGVDDYEKARQYINLIIEYCNDNLSET